MTSCTTKGKRNMFPFRVHSLLHYAVRGHVISEGVELVGTTVAVLIGPRAVVIAMLQYGMEDQGR